MSPTKCPICTAEICACEEPFSLEAIPQHHADGIARTILPAIMKYFECPENKAKYEKWLVDTGRA